MKAKYFITLMVIFVSISALGFAQQPPDAKVWFSPQKAMAYNFNYTYLLTPDQPVPIGGSLSIPTVITLGYSAVPPVKFCVAPSAALSEVNIIQFVVTLTFNSQKLPIEPVNISTSMTGMAITATVIEPGKITVEGVTIMGAGSPLSADKSLFHINLPPAAIPEESVTLQGKVDSFVMASSVMPDIIGGTAMVVVKAIPKNSNEVLNYGDENGDGTISIMDLLLVGQRLNQKLKYPNGTIIPYSMGDFNEDGEVTIVDALQVSRCFPPYGISEKYRLFLADVDFDDAITIVDALLIARYAAGALENF